MIVAVVSPHATCNGNTVASILTAVGLSDLKKKVFLSHTSPVSESFYTYLGLQSYEDKTSTPTQLVKLIKQDAIKSEDITDYCKTILDNLDVFTNDKVNFHEEDMLTLMECVLTVLPYDFAVIDVDEKYTSVADYVISKADIVVINLTQSILELKKFEAMKDSLARKYEGKVVILLCNQFSSVVSTDKEVLARIGLKTRCSILHRNSWIQWACNNGKMVDIIKNIKLRDYRVVELGSDISSIANTIVKARSKVIKKSKINKSNSNNTIGR